MKLHNSMTYSYIAIPIYAYSEVLSEALSEVCLDLFGRVWICLDLLGFYVGTCLDLLGPIWICLDFMLGPVWTCLDLFGFYVGTCLDLLGPIWTCLDFMFGTVWTCVDLFGPVWMWLKSL